MSQVSINHCMTNRTAVSWVVTIVTLKLWTLDRLDLWLTVDSRLGSFRWCHNMALLIFNFRRNYWHDNYFCKDLSCDFGFEFSLCMRLFFELSVTHVFPGELSGLIFWIVKKDTLDSLISAFYHKLIILTIGITVTKTLAEFRWNAQTKIFFSVSTFTTTYLYIYV